MNKFFKIISLCLFFIMCFTFTACEDEYIENIEYLQNEIVDTSVTYNSILQATAAITSNLTDEQKNVTLPNEYTSNVYEITSAGNYYFSGNLTSAITVAKNSGNVHIFLDCVSLSVVDSCAISSKTGSNIIITLIGTNSLSNKLGSENKDKNIVDSKENLVINGNGTLTINSTKSAIGCDGIFIGLGGIINATAEKHVVTADSIYIDGTQLNAVNCKKDILHAESDYDKVETAPEFSFNTGFVYIKSGTINTTTVLGDGIQADSFVYIKDGIFNLTTTPIWNNNYTATENKEKGMFSSYAHEKVARDDVKANSTYAVLEESVKGIKVGEIDYTLKTDTTTELTVESDKYTILIEGGTFDINTVDDAIHTNSGSVLIYGGNLTINTSDDGIHADKNLKITGNSIINIINSYEGIESETIDIDGGEITINALDDGINTANINLTETEQKSICKINISGGRLDVTVDPHRNRDAIDSNGEVKITGGIVIVRGPNNRLSCPLDVATVASVTGGTLILIGYDTGINQPINERNENLLITTLLKSQSSTKGLSYGEHIVTIDNITISYYNQFEYRGFVTVYSNSNAIIN